MNHRILENHKWASGMIFSAFSSDDDTGKKSILLQVDDRYVEFSREDIAAMANVVGCEVDSVENIV